jgi:enoyl-CoA hydratase
VSDDAVIGTPYARMWGAYLSGMWIYRLGLTKAKELALSGRPLQGQEAVDIGLVNQAVPFDQLESVVRERALELASVPPSQIAAMKLVVNHAYEQQGINAVQTLGPILDGLMRNTPEALDWIELAEKEGMPAALAQRDGAFGDYSQAAGDRKPNPENVIEP